MQKIEEGNEEQKNEVKPEPEKEQQDQNEEKKDEVKSEPSPKEEE